jgi:hypothetical protein
VQIRSLQQQLAVVESKLSSVEQQKQSEKTQVKVTQVGGACLSGLLASHSRLLCLPAPPDCTSPHGGMRCGIAVQPPLPPLPSPPIQNMRTPHPVAACRHRSR